MTETSYPFAGTTIGDAGPYNAEEWYDAWGAITHGGVENGDTRYYGYGVIHGVRNDLYPAENGTDIDVATGASLIDGLYHENDATVSIPVGDVASRPDANLRIDYIVVRKNYQQATTYTDPKGTAPSVSPRTARVTVVRGTEAAAPTAPSLTRNRSTYWDIPIATVQISTTGVLSSFTDQRQFLGTIVGTDIIAGDNTSLKTALEIIATVNDGAGAAEFGASLDYILENAGGNLETAMRLAAIYDDATDTTEDSRFELRLLADGSENLSGAISPPTTSSVDGNSRGPGSVDFQQKRSAVTEVASGSGSTLSGGNSNTASSEGSTVSGGLFNTASDVYATVSGGDSNTASGDYATASGGADNIASGTESTVSGGDTNTASGTESTVSGGRLNTASNTYATVSGGASNTASVAGSTVSGGNNNTASGAGSTALGGLLNVASGDYSTAGGANNTADGDYSFACGRKADTNTFNGVFIWADSEDAAFTADRADQFKVRASGGAHFVQNSTTGALPVITYEQEDTDEPFAKFIGDAAAATLTRDLVAEADVTTATRVGFYKIEILDDGNQVTDGDYFVPFYSLA